jgi:hypothetical protein
MKVGGETTFAPHLAIRPLEPLVFAGGGVEENVVIAVAIS